MLGLAGDGFWYEWDSQTHELRKRVSPDGEILQVLPNVPTEDAASRFVDEYLANRGNQEDNLRQAAHLAITVNNAQMAQNQALWDAAEAFRADMAIQNYDTTGKTQVQVIGDLLQGLKLLDQKTKQLAGGIQTLLVHDQTTKEQLNRLIELVIGKIDVDLSLPDPVLAVGGIQVSVAIT
jgi:hypothetical protein